MWLRSCGLPAAHSARNPDERSDIRNSLRRPLAIAGSTFLDLTRPILRQQAAPHVEMKRGMRPVANASHQAVFHWIVVNIVHVPDEIVLVANGVFPVTSLPEGKLTVRVATHRYSCSEQVSAEVSFDSSPTPGKIRVARRQGQHRVQVVRHDDHSIDRKGPVPP